MILGQNYKLVILDVESHFLSLSQNNTLTTFFDFPDTIKIACKQYLLYFAQFLEDIGINVNTSLKDHANQVLFEVVPKNSQQAIDKIRDALNIYLATPGLSKISENRIASNKNIAAYQWMNQVDFLITQLRQVEAELKMKDATIETLELSNYQYKQLLSETKSSEQDEKIIGDLVKITEFKSKGIKVNLPEILRILKRKLK